MGRAEDATQVIAILAGELVLFTAESPLMIDEKGTSGPGRVEGISGIRCWSG
jgi:hypothetical protein